MQLVVKYIFKKYLDVNKNKKILPKFYRVGWRSNNFEIAFDSCRIQLKTFYTMKFYFVTELKINFYKIRNSLTPFLLTTPPPLSGASNTFIHYTKNTSTSQDWYRPYSRYWCARCEILIKPPRYKGYLHFTYNARKWCAKVVGSLWELRQMMDKKWPLGQSIYSRSTSIP